MKDLVKPILKIVSWMFGALVVSFTGVQTWLLLFEATGSPYIALLGLTFFEGGMLYWWVSFQYTAEGLGQLALSVIMAVLSLAVVSAAAALHLGAVSMTIFGANTVSRLITAAAIVNLIAKFAYPLVSPKMIGIIREKVVEGQLSKRIHEEVESKIADRQPEIVKRLSDNAVRQLERNIINAHFRNETDMSAKPAPMLRANAYTVEDTQPLPVVAKPDIMAAESPTSSAPVVTTVDDAVFSQASLLP